MRFTSGPIIASLLCGTFASAQTPPTNTFTNPTGPRGHPQNGAADPWVFRLGDYYYMTHSTHDNITIRRSPVLTDWYDSEVKLAFDPPKGESYSTDLWAPELHHFDDKWYIIFTADPNGDSPSSDIDALCDYSCPAVHHRMYVLESSGSDPWESDYTLKAQLNTYDQFAIDGTYFRHATGLYHVYSCWVHQYQSWPSNLCITKMSNPWTVASNQTERVTLSTPSNPWEMTPYGRTANIRLASNEGPEQLVNSQTGQQFIVFSAARTDNRNYCLGVLELVGDDPMNVNDWKKHNDNCIFYQNPAENAYGVGHASFTKSPDGTEDWIVYHGKSSTGMGLADRTIRTQKFTWNEDGTPNFPRPGYGPYEVPSGQNHSMKMTGDGF